MPMICHKYEDIEVNAYLSKLEGNTKDGNLSEFYQAARCKLPDKHLKD